MMDQARILREFDFPTAMVLPAGFPSTPAGIELGIREFSDRSGMAVLLYIKQENYLSAAQVRSLVEDRTVCAIKYAVVRENPAEDPYLRSLVDAVDPRIVISGIGEQPAIVHMRDFGLAGFTSGCVCIAPGRSMQMLRAIQRRDWETADRIRLRFAPLEDLRNRFGPIPVLHQAVSLARIAETGPILPLMTNLSKDLWQSVAETSIELSEYEKTRAMETAGQEEVTSAPRDAGA
jgi:dihydrodipicolinate synthase/N-acetylneuraminate lyase